MNTADSNSLNQLRAADVILNDPLLIASALNQHFSFVCSNLTSDMGCLTSNTLLKVLFIFRQ